MPDSTRLGVLADAAQACRGCDLYARATQTVFGAGPRAARIMMIGEQPGDVEDWQGAPFVGPAGGLLHRAFGDAGIDPGSLYLTNAVKHFRWKSTARSSRRIHQTPSTSQVGACQPWLAAELAAVRPRVVVALGATAAAALFGAAFHVTAHRGEIRPWPPTAGPFATGRSPTATALATIHPSAVLRAGEDRDEMYRGFVEDLRLAAAQAATGAR